MLLQNAQAPHPLTNALAINPESAESITEIGWSRDLGTCSAIKLDGNRCSNWIDK
jgi:minichromosome maintenance protein 10